MKRLAALLALPALAGCLPPVARPLVPQAVVTPPCRPTNEPQGSRWLISFPFGGYYRFRIIGAAPSSWLARAPGDVAPVEMAVTAPFIVEWLNRVNRNAYQASPLLGTSLPTTSCGTPV